MLQPKFDPLFYARRTIDGKYTRMRAVTVAFERGMITLDEAIDLYNSILN